MMNSAPHSLIINWQDGDTALAVMAYTDGSSADIIFPVRYVRADIVDAAVSAAYEDAAAVYANGFPQWDVFGDCTKALRSLADTDRDALNRIIAGSVCDAVTDLTAERDRLRDALANLVSACDHARMVPRGGISGMTIEANFRGSVYNGVPAWPVEEARAVLKED